MKFKTIKLSDVSDAGMYGVAESAVDYDEKLPTYLRITDINDDGTLNQAGLKSVAPQDDRYYLRDNEIVFARTGNSVGKSYYYDERDGNFIFAGFLIKFALHETDEFYPRYLKYYTTTSEYWGWVHGVSNGSTRGNINAKMFADMPISLPPKSVQIEMVAVLDLLESKIRINRELNDNLLELASTLFEGSFPNVRGGENAIGTLMSNFDKQRKPLSKNQRAQRQGEYRYIGATSVVDHVDDFTFDGIYLLLGEDGTVQTDDGKPVLQYVWGPFWPNNHTHVLQGKGVSTEWLYLFWKNQNITSIITGAVQPKISQGNMNSIKVTKPSDVELVTFQQKVDPIFNMIRLNADEMENLKVIRDQLLKELLG
ncbi:restriction endonuclease subunit S [Weissella confusa]|uniref:restriction endonuclease subunit S n=1 Tax=Weissella confusa TaxID=1583 RepID=UPI0016805F48|nr:restriction endonuclease subunit S [Weissella confusa]MBD1491805.1 restriction endonuclease subunit S [Weissella confusa]MBJ7664435.1 hypothetical protein [Weissella confusa]